MLWSKALIAVHLLGNSLLRREGPVPDEYDSTLRDAHWKMYSENSIQARHHETQRAAVASTFIGISGAVIAFMTSDKTLSPLDLPPALLLVLLGMFGAVFSAKQYERINTSGRATHAARTGLS